MMKLLMLLNFIMVVIDKYIAIPTLTNISGQILDGVSSTLTLTGTLPINLVVNFLQTSDSINVDVTVTPTNSVSVALLVQQLFTIM